MKKLIFLLVVPIVSFAQNDSMRLDEKLQGKTGTEVKSPDLPKPLYFIDGKQTNEAVVNELNPDTIESINVLKGEKAIEKYGDEGKNGVVEIKMKEKKNSLNLTEILSGTVPGSNIDTYYSDHYGFRCPSPDPRNGSPLYVVDGIPQKINYSLDEISADEIANIIVLKDVQATALYGSRGRNGVIIIETKKYQEELDSKKEEYDLAVLDLGYESFLAMQPSAETYSLNYLENKNRQYVSVWNSRVISGNKDIYEMQIDYETQTYYGLEFEYKLFMFFKFMEDKHKISFS